VNGVDIITDPTRNFNSDEWNCLCPARSFVWQQRENAGQGNCDGGHGCFGNHDNGQRNAAAANVERNETPGTTGGASALTEATGQNSERGLQNGRGFGPGAYRQQSRILLSARIVKPEGGRSVKATEVIQYGTKEDTIGKNEIDNHADTICAGANSRHLLHRSSAPSERDSSISSLVSNNLWGIISLCHNVKQLFLKT
jgi:hypothetical protein